MTIEVACQCGRRFAAGPHLAGRRMPCPECGLPLSIPPGQPLAMPESPISVTCSCGQRFRAKPQLAGTLANCPMCHQTIPIPAPFAPSASAVDDPLPPTDSDDGFWDAISAPMPAMTEEEAAAERNRTNERRATQMARAEDAREAKEWNSWGTAQLLAGLVMTPLGVLAIILSITQGEIALWPFTLVIAGGIALLNGASQKLHR